MNDLETLCAMLVRANIPHSLDPSWMSATRPSDSAPGLSLTIENRPNGYIGFFTVFEFDLDGKLIDNWSAE